tara:strand:+ start:6506 stop:7435 length:930 start_codon:yes stop_codon:yes gene_type:complete
MVDILIPTYNRAHTILESIDSALNQVNVKVNVHVIDNNSSDDTLLLIKRNYSKQKNLFLHEFDDTVPMYMNWNRCLPYIKSKYFKFLFSDDLLSADFCFECLKVLEENDTVDLIATDLNYFEDNINYVGKIRKYNKNGLYNGKKIIFRSLLTRNNISAPSNSLIRSLRLNSTNFTSNRVATDWIFFADILYNNSGNLNYCYLEKPLAYFRTSGLTETNELKISADWIILNYEARRKMSMIFSNYQRWLIRILSLSYCSIVLVFIRKKSSTEYSKARDYLRNQSLWFPILFLLISLLMRIDRVEKMLWSK